MAKDKEKDKDEAEEALVVVTDHEDDLDVPPTGEGVAMETVDEKPAKLKKKAAANGKDKDDDDDDDHEPGEPPEDEEDTRLGASEETDEEDQRRASHKSRRQRKKEAEQRLRRERDFLEKRNEQLERQLAEGFKNADQRIEAVEKSQLDQRIAQAKGIIKKADGVIADAITNQKGDEAAEATRIRDEWRDHLKELETSRSSLDEEDTEERKPPPANPRVIAMAKQWHSKNSWFDFKEGDLDSKVVGLIDRQVAQEGYDPTTKEYWDEVTKRAKTLIPHRFKKKAKDDTDEDEDVEDVADEQDEDDDEEPKPKPKKGGNGKPKVKPGGPRFRTGGPGRDLGTNEVHLSRERIAALKELGVWDDPKLRNKYLQKYKDWDDQHPDLVN